VSVICNSVDTRRYNLSAGSAATRRGLGLDEGDHVMAVVATFKRQKGHRFLIEAANTVVPQFPNLHILFIGDGELREELQALTKRLGLEGHIHFLGTRGDVPALLAASDSFALPSLWEGLPMALIEAMASGLPVIATEVSGTNQVMVSGETGLLVPPGDASALATAIASVLTDPARAASMGAAARQRVEEYFGAQEQARAHVALFERERMRAFRQYRGTSQGEQS
jgi:glycosyltransferase involved in cell wall biosynthesis